MTLSKFVIELNPSIDLHILQNTFDKIKPIFEVTKSVSLTSKPLGQSIAGFDISYRFANYLIEREPHVDILFHLTCYDLNKINIQTRLDLLRKIGINRVLIISGDGYKVSDKPKVRALQFKNSHELAKSILQDHICFQTVAVAGYPGGNQKDSKNNKEEVERLSSIIDAGVTDVYTQCIFNLEDFLDFSEKLKNRHPHLNIVPSLALFKSSIELERILKLTRVTCLGLDNIKSIVEQADKQDMEGCLRSYFKALIDSLILSGTLIINLCPFGNHKLTMTLITRKPKVED